MADLADVNDLKTKLGGAFFLILALGFSGCFFHHHKSSDSDMDSGDDQQAQPQPQAQTAAHGAHKMTRSKASDLSEMTHNPDRHLGQFVSTYGPVRSITVKPDGSTEFIISTPNYAYFFIVTFPGEIPNLEQNKDTYFLGAVRGSRTLGEVEALVVDGIAIQTTGGRGLNPYAWPKAVYVPGQEQAVSAWLNGELDLRDSANSTVRSYTAMSAAPAPAPNYYQPPAPQAPAYSAPAYSAPAPAYAPPPPAYRGGNTGSIDSASLVKVVQNWNQLPPEAKERILGIVSEYSR